MTSRSEATSRGWMSWTLRAGTTPIGAACSPTTTPTMCWWIGRGKPTHGIQEHIDAMKAYVDSAGGTPPRITSHPISFGSGEWTCVIGEFEDGSRMVTVAKWQDGAIAEEYIWA